jgi:hypothetical protein
VRLDQDWLAARVGARAGLVSASGRSALVAIIVTAGRDAEEKDQEQHREGALDHSLKLAAQPIAVN